MEWGGDASFRVAGIVHALNTIKWSSYVTNDAQIVSDVHEAELPTDRCPTRRWMLLFTGTNSPCSRNSHNLLPAKRKGIFVVFCMFLKRYEEQQLGFSMALPLLFCAFMRYIVFLVRPFTPLGEYYKYLAGVEIYFTGYQADSDD